MLKPAYKLTIGSKVIDTTDEPQASTLTDLMVSLDMDTPADSLALRLGNVDGLKPELGDKSSIELGYEDNGGLEKVMTGSVVSVKTGLTITRVIVHSPASLLLHAFTDKTYEGRSAGEMVRDLAEKAGVDIEKADDGIAFPAYVVDGRRNFYQHMRDLADLSGLDLYINPEGKVVFEKFISGKKIHVFEYGKHIIELEVLKSNPPAEKVEAWGESPGGGKAAEAWSWLTKDFSKSKGVSGSGDGKVLIEQPVIRTSKAAGTVAEAARIRIQEQAVKGRLLLQGQPQVRLGDAIRLVGVQGMEKPLQVRNVAHRIAKSGGFTTTVGFRAIEA